MLVNDLVRAHVTALSKCLATDIAVVRSLASVATLVGLFLSAPAYQLPVDEEHTFRFPSWENLCPHDGSLHTCCSSVLAGFGHKKRVTYEGLEASMGSPVDIQMGLLVEALVAARHVALVPLLALLPGLHLHFLGKRSAW